MPDPIRTLRHEYAGANWLRSSLKVEPSPLGAVVADMLGLVYRGLYHIHGPVSRTDWTCSYEIRVRMNRGADLASFDFAEMTLLTLLAHDLAIRVQVSGRGMSALCLSFTARSVDLDAHLFNRHPSLEDHVQRLRSAYTVVPVIAQESAHV